MIFEKFEQGKTKLEKVRSTSELETTQANALDALAERGPLEVRELRDHGLVLRRADQRDALEPDRSVAHVEPAQVVDLFCKLYYM